MRFLGFASSLAIAAALAIAPTYAQTQAAAPQPDPNEGEIIVTGLKRDQALIDVPVAVAVFDEAAIARAGITRPQDFLAQTTNITFIQSNHAGEAFVNVRGQTSVRQSESAVAVVIDGVQLATQNEFNGELFDIAQIEVLKGPQGAIYGRNASAGAIVITTRAPTDNFEGSLLASYGNWNSSKMVASVGGPIVPGVLRFRASGALNDTEGPFRNIVTGEDSYRSNEKLGRLRFDWTPSEVFSADLRINFSRLRGGAIAANAQGPGIRNGGVPSPVDGNATDAPFVTDVPGRNRQDKFSTSLKLDRDLGRARITSVTAWNEITDDYQAKLFPYHAPGFPGNDAGNAILFGDQTQKYRIANQAFTQEIRITSNSGGRLRWQGGLYFLKSRRDFTTEQGFNGRVPLTPSGAPAVGVNGYLPNPAGAIFASLDPAISTFLFGAPFNRFDRVLIGGGAIAPTIGIDGLTSSNPTNAYDVTRFRARNIAPFGNIQFDITSNLELGLAVRYDIEKREVQTLTPDLVNPFTGASFNQCVAVLGVAASTCVRERTFKQAQPKATLTWKLPDVGSLYASWGRSFKSGGFNPIGTRELVVRATQVGITRPEAEALVFVQDSYDKEVADTYEAGLKAQLFERRLNVNGALFWTDLRNSQQFIFFPAGSIQAVQAIDKVRIRGFEIDASARLSDALSVFAGYGYIDSRIRRYAAAPQSVGNRTPYVSPYNLTLGGQLNQPIWDDVALNARVEYNRSGSIWFDAVNTPGTRRRAVDLVNARLGFGTERWELTAWSRNLFNERYRMESVVLVTGVGIFNPGFKAATRSFGLEGKVRF